MPLNDYSKCNENPLILDIVNKQGGNDPVALRGSTPPHPSTLPMPQEFQEPCLVDFCLHPLVCTGFTASQTAVGMGWDRMGSQQLEIGVVRVFTLTGFPFPQFASHTQRKGTWAMKEKRLRKKMKSVRSYEHHRPTYVNLIYTLWS